METAREEREAGSAAAKLVESCRCPPGYAGLSCQVKSGARVADGGSTFTAVRP